MFLGLSVCCHGLCAGVVVAHVPVVICVVVARARLHVVCARACKCCSGLVHVLWCPRFSGVLILEWHVLVRASAVVPTFFRGADSREGHG